MQSNYFEIYICRNSVCSVANSLDSFQSCHCLFDSFLLNGRTLQQTTSHVPTCQLHKYNKLVENRVQTKKLKKVKTFSGAAIVGNNCTDQMFGTEQGLDASE